MEQNLQIIAKKFIKIVKVVYFMLRKGISKAKLLVHLNMMMKRSKIAGKAAMHSLIFHHHGGSASGHHLFAAPSNEYEFSCSNSPAFHLPFHLNKRKHSPPPPELMAAVAEMFHSAEASPQVTLPGFGPSPMVRKLRVTDSPFPVRDVDEDSRVDEDAEEFIMKFYKDLRLQNSMASLA